MNILHSLDKVLVNSTKKDYFIITKASNFFLEYVNSINDSEIKEFVYSSLSKTCEEFWICACSSSGKHHPNEDNGLSGLLRHLTKAAEVSNELIREFDIESEKDCVLAATLLHDICKNGTPKDWAEKTDSKHGIIAYNWLNQFSLREPEKEKIRNAVRYHMGRWTESYSEEETLKERGRALNPNPIERIVQLSDYIASRKGVSFMPKIDVTKSKDYRINFS